VGVFPVESKSKILIADDEADAVELLKKRLRFEGYETLEAYDGVECLRQASEGNPDLIILDVMMPEMDGYEVCRRLKASKKTAQIPVLMLTAKREVENKVKGLDIGAHDYLTKPFDYQELSARVKSLLTIKADKDKLVQEVKSEALDHMIDELAHELRNPLTSIGGFARRVYENLPEGDPNKKNLAIILIEVARLEKMVAALVDLKTSAISYRESAGLNDLIVRVTEQLQEEFTSMGIEVSLELMEPCPLLPVDSDHMMLALRNILENSIEAMQDKAERKIRIVTSVENDWVQVHISDTGKGIPKEKIKNIFDPFFTSKIAGPGLGLTFALKIIQQHRGTISVESEPGVGSNFIVRLPLRKS
jgi:two-component system, sensor histidine kinase and response regulator